MHNRSSRPHRIWQPLTSGFSSFKKFLQENSQWFQSFCFRWWISSWRSSLPKDHSARSLPSGKFFELRWTSKELFAAMRWGNVFGNRPWMVDCWRLWFFVCQHQPQCLSLRMKTKFGTIVTCKRPKALKCKLSTWAAGLQKCTNPFQPGERTESHHHWGAKSQNMILFDEPLFKTGWWCDQGPLIKSLVIGPLGWLFHERKSWRLHEWRFRSQGTSTRMAGASTQASLDTGPARESQIHGYRHRRMQYSRCCWECIQWTIINSY